MVTGLVAAKKKAVDNKKKVWWKRNTREIKGRIEAMEENN